MFQHFFEIEKEMRIVFASKDISTTYSILNVVFFQVYVDIKPPHRCVRVIYKPGQVYVNPMVDGGDFMAQSGMLTYEVVQNFPKKNH